MGTGSRGSGGPRSAVIVGAGMVGLSTAWFLQERGVEVTVVDRAGVAAGASHGNAGWLSPGLAIPLNEPSVLRYGLRSLADPKAPLHVPVTVDPDLWRFLLRFAAHCTWGSWRRAAHAGLPLNQAALDAFDELAANGVRAETHRAPVTALFRDRSDATHLLQELRRMREVGQHIDYTGLEGPDLRERLPQASGQITAAVRLDGQRYVDPGAFTRSLADSVRDRGGVVLDGFEVIETHRSADQSVVRSSSAETISADVLVLATGAWLDRLSRQWGVRVPVRAGRGYSFTVPTSDPVTGPIYLPEARVACTPYRGSLRVAGTMEFQPPDAALDQARIEAIVDSARPLLTGVDWDRRTDEWVGPRPVTPDGRALVGEVGVPGVYVAGGHGMWGLTQGPVTGRLLAELITTGRRPDPLRELDPLR
ncbi:amino acid dehydrogenase [Actinoalloteichus sp. AHMU CJ021]|uniref:NAD(P)/FAD-dependent oxidoreductase n=1 Tax=Actinoalloteichus sp. AHMU CJ021 TaxID=2072503 RepID=UPI000CA00160|nr:amino acid dehydrogenase [Actinoalloteichus sp. AHMU CJ021]